MSVRDREATAVFAGLGAAMGFGASLLLTSNALAVLLLTAAGAFVGYCAAAPSDVPED